MVRTYFESTLRWDGEAYGNGRHPDLPWGYWLTSSGNVHGEPPLVDEDGRQWSSVREAFWSGRLGFPDFHYRWVDAVLGFMMSYLAVHDSRFVDQQERIRDIFLGDGHLDQFFSAFMITAGFMKANQDLTPEGRAVLAMLIATRSQEESQDDVGLPWISANRGFIPHRNRTKAADMIAEREIVASRMKNRFAADSIDDCPVVKLVSFKVTDEIPLRSTIWSMSWEDGDRYARDAFYLWLLERIDRWDEWTMMVEARGTRALTEHIMKLAFTDRFPSVDRAA